jgi:glycosyltransferase involved in cell wall biosynthesis
MKANNGPVRVLAVMDKLGYGSRLYGPGRMWLSTLGAFDKRRCVMIPCVLRMDERLNAQFAKQGIHLIDLRKGRFDLTAIGALCRLIRKERIDVLHLHGDGATTFGRIAARMSQVPAIAHYHDTAEGVPAYVRWMDRLLASSTARAVAISQAVSQACQSVRRLKPEQIAVIPNAIDLDWAQELDQARVGQLREELGLRPGARVIGSVTRFRWEKDVPTTLRALERLDTSVFDWQAVIIGDGPDRSSLEKMAKQLGMSQRVKLAGFQPNVRPYLALMDVAVFSSATEGFGLALLEAMAAGRPIVATAVGGMAEIIRDGGNGLLVPAQDPLAMAGAIARLLRDLPLAQRLARQARADAQRFGVREHVEQLTALYRSVVA